MRFNIYGFMNPTDGEGSDLGGGQEQEVNVEHQESLDPKAQEIINQINGTENQDDDNKDDDEPLPSEANDKPLLADKYEDRDSLIKGITNIGNDLPEYIINGMSDEALVMHYKELQKNFTKDNQENKERKYSEDNKDEKPEDKENSTDVKALWKDLEVEFTKTGKISSEIYDKLEEAGIPSDIVDGYADKLVADSKEFTNQVLEIAGGEENYNVIKSWAEENYTQEQLDAIVTLPRDSMLIALQGIKSAYDLANPKQEQPSDRLRGNNPNSSGSVYKSQDDYLLDVKNPKYGKDTIYTKKVEEKLKRSKF